jgi:hypothetical protein
MGPWFALFEVRILSVVSSIELTAAGLGCHQSMVHHGHEIRRNTTADHIASLFVARLSIELSKRHIARSTGCQIWNLRMEAVC